MPPVPLHVQPREGRVRGMGRKRGGVSVRHGVGTGGVGETGQREGCDVCD